MNSKLTMDQQELTMMYMSTESVWLTPAVFSSLTIYINSLMTPIEPIILSWFRILCQITSESFNSLLTKADNYGELS